MLDLALGTLEHGDDQRGEAMRRHDCAASAGGEIGGAATALAVGVALAVALGLAACGSDDKGGNATTSGSATTAATPTSPAFDVLTTAAANPTATIALTAPVEGATVDRSFTVAGLGSAFEGTLLWTLTGGTGAQPTSGYATAGMTSPKPFRFTVEAPEAGSYTLTVYRESASDGAKTDAVSRTITVR